MLSMEIKQILEKYDSYCFSLFKEAIEKFKKLNFLEDFEEREVENLLSLEKNYFSHSSISSFLIFFSQDSEKLKKEELLILKKYFFLEFKSLLLKNKIIDEFKNNYNISIFSRNLQIEIKPFECITLEKKFNYYKLSDNVDFIFVENNPYFIKSGNSLSLGDIHLEKWLIEFQSALKFIEIEVPFLFNRISPFLDTIGPFGFDNFNQNSLSLVFSPRVIYLSYVEDYIVQAEAIIHEVYHSMIDIFSFFDTGVENILEEKYYSSVQKKPRPIENCLLALHAFIGVETFYRYLLEEQKITNDKYFSRLFLVYNKNKELINVLDKYAIFTNFGKTFYQELLDEHKINLKFIFNLIDKSEKHLNLFRIEKQKVENHKKEVINLFPEILY